MTEIGLKELDKDSSQPFIRLVSKLCCEAAGVAEVHGFPGTLPLTLSRRHIDMICHNDYVLLEKSDGTRYFLLILENHAFLIDRKYSFYPIVPKPPFPLPNEAMNSTVQEHHETLLDGELCVNLATDTWEYLVYDVVAIQGDHRIGQKNYRSRMLAVEDWVVRPRLLAASTAGSLRIRIKDVYEKTEIDRLFSRIYKNEDRDYVYENGHRFDGCVCNRNDGLIFTPVQLAYPLKSCSALLKWKYPLYNSVDFMLFIEVDGGNEEDPRNIHTYLGYKGDRGVVRYREVFFPSSLKKKWAESRLEHHGKIIECSYDRMAGEWRYLRHRTDKTTPNYSTTVMDTLESTAESITREELIDRIKKNTKATKPTLSQRRPSWKIEDDDLFNDSNNPKYRKTTPISLLPPPSFIQNNNSV
ncbi:mRNA-capping enzyme [Galdieria sulphuraria]|nr:mRNA-capping enzyme [Galdieria sulphuraria]